MNTPDKCEGAVVQFTKHQILANRLHDQGMDPSAIEESRDVEEIENNPGPSRSLDFDEIV